MRTDAFRKLRFSVDAVTPFGVIEAESRVGGSWEHYLLSLASTSNLETRARPLAIGQTNLCNVTLDGMFAFECKSHSRLSVDEAFEWLLETVDDHDLDKQRQFWRFYDFTKEFEANRNRLIECGEDIPTFADLLQRSWNNAPSIPDQQRRDLSLRSIDAIWKDVFGYLREANGFESFSALITFVSSTLTNILVKYVRFRDLAADVSTASQSSTRDRVLSLSIHTGNSPPTCVGGLRGLRAFTRRLMLKEESFYGYLWRSPHRGNRKPTLGSQGPTRYRPESRAAARHFVRGDDATRCSARRTWPYRQSARVRATALLPARLWKMVD